MSREDLDRGIADTTLLLIVAILALSAIGIMAVFCGGSEALIILIVTVVAGLAGYSGGALSVYSRTRQVLKAKDRNHAP